MLKKVFKGYSIAEALVTLFIISVIFVTVAPSVVGKKPKIASFVQAVKSHGVYTCTSGTCNFNLPGDVKDIYVIAVGGGGGGAGASCGEEGTTYNGKQEEDVKGEYKYTPKRTLYVSASSASGGSTQLTGDCDYYKPADKFNVNWNHSYECNVWWSQGIQHYYRERRDANYCTHKYWENVDHPYYVWVEKCETRQRCKGYGWIKQENGTSTWGCTGQENYQYCWDEQQQRHDWYYEWVYRSEQCDSRDTTLPWRYSLEWYSQSTRYNGYCDHNRSPHTPSGDFQCGYLKQDTYYGAYPHIGTDLQWQYIVTAQRQREVDLTGRSDVCNINWLHKPEVNRPNRYCNAAVFGGRGGNGRAYYKRVCPIPGDGKCTLYREAHSIPSSCTKQQIEEKGAQIGCEKVYWTTPSGAVDKYIQTVLDKCSAWSIQNKLKTERKCGHRYGEYNCYAPHTGAVPRTCVEWDNSAKTIGFTIGYPGKAGKPTGTAGRDIILNQPTATADGTSSIGFTTIDGGEAGRLNAHGANKGGVAGGGHTGMSQEYSAIPTYHTQPGNPGWLGFAVKYINVGLGGQAGKTHAGYFKNIEGPVTIQVGAGGKGGVGGNGSKGGNTIVKARKGGFNTFYDVPAGEETPTGDTAKNASGNTDKGNSDGTLFNAAGGDGGTQRKQYETCEVEGGTQLFDSDANLYTGGQGYASDIPEYGHGGDGAGGKVPNCSPSTGKDGQNGAVIIFY